MSQINIRNVVMRHVLIHNVDILLIFIDGDNDSGVDESTQGNVSKTYLISVD